jgi:hypothetical protein
LQFLPRFRGRAMARLATPGKGLAGGVFHRFGDAPRAPAMQIASCTEVADRFTKAMNFHRGGEVSRGAKQRWELGEN